jgi:phage tail sheath protein FI
MIADAMIDQCDRLGDRFAIFAVTAGRADVNAIPSPRDAPFAASYYPWLRVRDPFSGLDVVIPPVGHIAGIYARSDAARGLHQSPTDLAILGLSDGCGSDDGSSLEFVITPDQVDILARKGINGIRNVGAGEADVRVVGGRTMAIDESRANIGNQRFILFLSTSITRWTQWACFEDQTEELYEKIRLDVTEFLTRYWKMGVLAGATPEEAFFVKCDRSLMTDDDRASRRLYIVYGVSLAESGILQTVSVRQNRPGGSP